MSFLLSRPVRSKIGTADLDVPTGLFLGAAFGQGFHDSALSSLYRMSEYMAASTPDEVRNPLIPAEQANHEAQQMGLSSLRFDRPISTDEFNLITERKQAEQRRQFILSAGGGGAKRTVGAFGAAMIGSISNPTDFALMFIPVVGPGGKVAVAAKGASRVQKARVGLNNLWKRGIVTNEEHLRKIGVPLTPIVGSAVDGAVGQAITEIPLVLASTQDQSDYTVRDSALAVAFGAGFGAALRGGLMGAQKIYSRLSNKTKEALSITAKEDFLAGEDINPIRIAEYDDEFLQAILEEELAISLDDAAVPTPLVSVARAFEEAIKAKKAQSVVTEIDAGKQLTPEKIERNSYGGAADEAEVANLEAEIADLEEMLKDEFGGDPLGMRLSNLEGMIPPGERLVHRTKHLPSEIKEGKLYFTLEERDELSKYIEFGDKKITFEAEGNEHLLRLDREDYWSMVMQDEGTLRKLIRSDSKALQEFRKQLLEEKSMQPFASDLDFGEKMTKKLETGRKTNNYAFEDAFINAYNRVSEEEIVEVLKGVAARNPDKWKEAVKELPVYTEDPQLLQGRLLHPKGKTRVTQDIRYHAERDTSDYLLDGKHQPEIDHMMTMVEIDLPHLKPLFDHIRTTDPSFNEINLKFDHNLISSKGATGIYDGYTDTISLDKYFTHKTFVHELIHGLTTRRIRKALQPKAPVVGEGRAAFTSTFKAARRGVDYVEGIREFSVEQADTPLGRLGGYYVKALKEFEKQTGTRFSEAVNGGIDRFFDFGSETPHYGLYNLDEFIAEAISNPQFQKFLNNIKGSGNKTLWQSFIDTIKEIFGIKGDGTLLDDILTEFARVSETGVRTPDLHIPRVVNAAKQLTPDAIKSATACILTHAA